MQISDPVRLSIGFVLLPAMLALGPGAAAAAPVVFWTQNSNGFGEGQLYRAPAFNPTSAALLAAGTDAFSVLALDAATGTLYWAGNAIERSNLDGDNRERVADGSFSEGLAIDSANGVLYRTSWDGTIQRSDLDGANAETIFATSQALYGLALDPIATKLYFTARDSFIYRVDLDGSNVQQLADGGREPLGITLDVSSGRMYWASHRPDFSFSSVSVS